jgi:hypothetical protein
MAARQTRVAPAAPAPRAAAAPRPALKAAPAKAPARKMATVSSDDWEEF